MRRKSSLWKTTAVSLSAMMTLSMGAAVLAVGTEQTTHESQTEDNTENKSADTDEASNIAETKTEECKIELSDNGILGIWRGNPRPFNDRDESAACFYHAINLPKA